MVDVVYHGGWTSEKIKAGNHFKYSFLFSTHLTQANWLAQEKAKTAFQL